MKNKENEENKTNSKKVKENKNQTSKIYILEIFLKIFIFISAILALTLFIYFRANNIYEEEMSMTKDIHHVKAYFKGYDNNSGIKGYVEILEVHEGLNIMGRIEGLERGSTHGVHILEYSDITDLEKNKITDDVLRHYNPTNKLHSCPSTNYDEDQNFHYGDLGNVIANEAGIAFFSIVRKIPLRSLNGRIIVISAVEDKCDPTQDIDLAKNIIGYGLLNAFKPKVNVDVNRSNDYFLREINSVNKKEFEKINKINKTVVVSNNNQNYSKKEVTTPEVKSFMAHKQVNKPVTTIKKPSAPILENKIQKNDYKTKESEKEVKLNVGKKEDENKIEKTIDNSSNEEKLDDKNYKILDKIGDKLYSDFNIHSFDDDINRNPNKGNNNNFKQRSNRIIEPQFSKEPSIKVTELNTFPSIQKNEKSFFEEKPKAKTVQSTYEQDTIHPFGENINHRGKNDLFVFPFSEINNKKEPIIEDTHHRMNHFNNLFEEDDHENELRNSVTEKDKERPVLVNKNSEPQFLHLNHELKLNKNAVRELPLFIRPSNPMRVNPIYPIYPIIPSDKPSMDEKINQNPNHQIEDIFKKIFKDQDQNKKIITVKPIDQQAKKLNEINQYSVPSTFEQNIKPIGRKESDQKDMSSLHQSLKQEVSTRENNINQEYKIEKNSEHVPSIFDSIEEDPLTANEEDPLSLISAEPLGPIIKNIPLPLPIQENQFHKSKNDFSFMSPNIEPIVNGLMKNSTSTKLVNNLDQDLLNPYKDNIDVPTNRFNADSFMVDFNKKLSINEEKEKVNKKVLADKLDKHDEMNVMNKIDNIKEIIKNNTISQLNNFIQSENENNQTKLNTKTEYKKKEKLPILLEKQFTVINKMDPYENFKLLKFKESNEESISQDSKTKLTLVKKIKPLEIFPNYKNLTSKQKSGPAESTNKMMENINNEEKKIKNLNLHDEDKLFIKDIKNNINKLDDISKKFKNI